VTFFTVCGGGEEYEFLLGGIEHHARIGNHLVLDVSPEPKLFRGLPGSVHWIGAQDPGAFGSGDWKTFRLASALEHARLLALNRFPDTHFLVHLDSDEYYDADLLRPLLTRYERPPIETPRVFVFEAIHWRDGRALRFGAGERHLRAWDVRANARIQRNIGWPVSPHYNGNPEHHPVAAPEGNYQVVNVHEPVHYHVHYALGKKRFFTETAETTIDGWPDGTPIPDPCPWPEPLQRWAEAGELPSSKFSCNP
jgi:hypothetical protein